MDTQKKALTTDIVVEMKIGSDKNAANINELRTQAQDKERKKERNAFDLRKSSDRAVPCVKKVCAGKMVNFY